MHEPYCADVVQVAACAGPTASRVAEPAKSPATASLRALWRVRVIALLPFVRGSFVGSSGPVVGTDCRSASNSATGALNCQYEQKEISIRGMFDRFVEAIRQSGPDPLPAPSRVPAFNS